MEGIFNWISANSPIIILSMTAIFLIILFVFLITIRKLNKTAQKYNTFMAGTEGDNLEKIILDNTKTLRQVLFEMNIFRERLEVVEDVSEKSIQKVGLLRFDAFEDMGGKQSFALALLNGKGDGVVLSSLYGREESRVYAKPVKGGLSEYTLSKEEEIAVQQALMLDQRASRY